ncbi:hypothetical protein GCM10020000_80960 [Streptomyces olivoverticillatus]
MVVGAAIGAAFVRRQLRLETPLLELRLLRARPFTAVLVALVLAGVAMAGTGLLVTQYLQNVLGHSSATSALLFAPPWAWAWRSAPWPPRRWPGGCGSGPRSPAVWRCRHWAASCWSVSTGRTPCPW